MGRTSNIHPLSYADFAKLFGLNNRQMALMNIWLNWKLKTLGVKQ